MTVEVLPVGVACNLGCTYCYQNPMRDAGNFTDKEDYDIDAIIKTLDGQGSDFNVFGGEALLVPIKDLEKLWAYGFKRFNKNGIQSNGVLITDEHIKLFKKYKVSIGISMDGPDELNSLRWAGSKEKTDASTAKTMNNIKKVLDAGIPVSLIITLHRVNATEKRLPRLIEWVKELDRIGVNTARLHLLEVDNELTRNLYTLTTDQMVNALMTFNDLEKELNHLKFDIFGDMNRLLRGDDKVTCIWVGCDSYTTSAVQGIGGDGDMHNCGRTSDSGIYWKKADTAGYERYLSLYNTPQEYNGCKDCRFWLMCRGQCPGTAIDKDWRNKTEHCEVWMRLYEYLETEMVNQNEMPLSLHPKLRFAEKIYQERWALGSNPPLASVLASLHQVEPTQSSDSHTRKFAIQGHGDHNDSPVLPHGDGHGDDAASGLSLDVQERTDSLVSSSTNIPNHGDHWDTDYSNG